MVKLGRATDDARSSSVRSRAQLLSGAKHRVRQVLRVAAPAATTSNSVLCLSLPNPKPLSYHLILLLNQLNNHLHPLQNSSRMLAIEKSIDLAIPEDVEVSVNARKITVKGARGTLTKVSRGLTR